MATINSTMLSDGLSDEPSSPESTTFDDSDLLRSAVTDDVTAQLAAAGKLFILLLFLKLAPSVNVVSSYNKPITVIASFCTAYVLIVAILLTICSLECRKLCFKSYLIGM